MTKDELLAAIKRDRAAFDAVVARIPPDRLEEHSLHDGWAPKDVLAHIMAWQQRCMAWIRNGGGDEPTFTQEGMAAYNAEVFERHKDRSLDDIQKVFDSTHNEIVGLVESMEAETVAAPPAWADPIPLVSILSSNTDEHYRVHAIWLTRWLESMSGKAAS
jgi:hypothetical protein